MVVSIAPSGRIFSDDRSVILSSLSNGSHQPHRALEMWQDRKIKFLIVFNLNEYNLNLGLPGSSAGKESTCNTAGPSSIPWSGRSAGEGIGYPPQYSWASLVAQLV